MFLAFQIREFGLAQELSQRVKKGDKMKPRWLGQYKLVKCLDKGVVKIANPKTRGHSQKGCKSVSPQALLWPG